jgi:hypothetical protein
LGGQYWRQLKDDWEQRGAPLEYLQTPEGKKMLAGQRRAIDIRSSHVRPLDYASEMSRASGANTLRGAHGAMAMGVGGLAKSVGMAGNVAAKLVDLDDPSLGEWSDATSQVGQDLVTGGAADVARSLGVPIQPDRRNGGFKRGPTGIGGWSVPSSAYSSLPSEATQNSNRMTKGLAGQVAGHAGQMLLGSAPAGTPTDDYLPTTQRSAKDLRQRGWADMFNAMSGFGSGYRVVYDDKELQPYFVPADSREGRRLSPVGYTQALIDKQVAQTREHAASNPTLFNQVAQHTTPLGHAVGPQMMFTHVPDPYDVASTVEAIRDAYAPTPKAQPRIGNAPAEPAVGSAYPALAGLLKQRQTPTNTQQRTVLSPAEHAAQRRAQRQPRQVADIGRTEGAE